VRTISRKDSGPADFDVECITEALGQYLAGFANGEGSFNLSFRPRGDYRQPWKISLCFNVSQRDPAVLMVLREQLCCGTMRQRADGCWYYEVNSLDDLNRYVLPFFRRFGFLAPTKQRDFAKFCELTALMLRGQHLTLEGVRKILDIRRDMNDGGKRRYSEEEILARYTGESSETVRQRPTKSAMRQSELRGDAQSG
jgi:hypothetical protein